MAIGSPKVLPGDDFSTVDAAGAADLAEAEREKRAKITNAEAESQAPPRRAPSLTHRERTCGTGRTHSSRNGSFGVDPWQTGTRLARRDLPGPCASSPLATALVTSEATSQQLCGHHSPGGPDGQEHRKDHSGVRDG
jgi:hypothetical protein